MDEPIYCLPPGVCQAKREPTNLVQRGCFAVWSDDKDEYLKFINEPGFDQQRRWGEVMEIFGSDALNIGIAMLSGETKGFVEMEDVLLDGMTPLHFAAYMSSPRLTKYLIDRGDNVDECVTTRGCLPCVDDELQETFFYLFDHVKQATPLDVAIQVLYVSFHLFLPLPLPTNLLCLCTLSRSRDECRDSLFHIISWICRWGELLETIRLLVQNTKDKERVRKAVIANLEKGKLLPFAALFVSAPELFLSPESAYLAGGPSSFGMLYLVSNSLEKKTYNQELLTALLDFFAIVGHKLVAYVRLEKTRKQMVDQTDMEIDFFIREVSRKKLGVSSPDYYFWFFKPLRPEADPLSSLDLLELKNTWDYLCRTHGPGPWMFDHLHRILMINDIDQASIYRALPVLKPDDADRLDSAIEKKLSAMQTTNSSLQDITGIHQPRWSTFDSGRNFDPNGSSYFKNGAIAKSWLDFKFAPTNNLVNKVRQPTRLKSVFPVQILPRLYMVAKRLFK